MREGEMDIIEEANAHVIEEANAHVIEEANAHAEIKSAFLSLPDEGKWALLYQTQVTIENKLDKIIELMETVSDSIGGFAENMPEPLKMMFGM